MDQIRENNIYISNFDFISYQSNELIQGTASNIHYSDFYTFYNSYIKSLSGVSWKNNKIKLLISDFPVLQKPRIPLRLFTFSFIPLVIGFILNFNLYTYIGVFFVLLTITGMILFWMKLRNKDKLIQIVNICNSIKNELERN